VSHPPHTLLPSIFFLFNVHISLTYQRSVLPYHSQCPTFPRTDSCCCTCLPNSRGTPFDVHSTTSSRANRLRRNFTCGKSGDADNLWSHSRIIHKDEQRVAREVTRPEAQFVPEHTPHLYTNTHMYDTNTVRVSSGKYKCKLFIDPENL
jgi:hypothetical protein